MTLEDRLRLHLADKGAAWRTEAAMTIALWEEDGPRAVALLPQPLSAASVVEAYVARPPGARLTLVHEGPLSPVAQRSAARFGIALLDAATLPEPAPAFELEVAAMDAAPSTPVFEPLHAPPALLVAHEPALLLPAHAEASVVPDEPLPALFFEGVPTLGPAEPAPAPELPLDLLAVADEILALAPAYEPPIVEASASVTVETSVVPGPPAVAEAAPAIATVQAPDEPAPLVEDGPALPWDPKLPLAEAPLLVQVTAAELAALPWHAHAPIEEHVEIMAGSPRARRHVERPTLAPSLDAHSWGLPWPRPVPSTDALSIADPRIWSSQERVHAMREDLDARVGAASFGAVKPEGSAWIRRMQTFGPQP